MEFEITFGGNSVSLKYKEQFSTKKYKKTRVAQHTSYSIILVRNSFIKNVTKYPTCGGHSVSLNYKEQFFY